MREPYPNELYHYGVKGMKWGKRKVQKYDGTHPTSSGSLHTVGSGLHTGRVGEGSNRKDRITDEVELLQSLKNDLEKFNKSYDVVKEIRKSYEVDGMKKLYQKMLDGKVRVIGDADENHARVESEELDRLKEALDDMKYQYRYIEEAARFGSGKDGGGYYDGGGTMKGSYVAKRIYQKRDDLKRSINDAQRIYDTIRKACESAVKKAIKYESTVNSMHHPFRKKSK